MAGSGSSLLDLLEVQVGTESNFGTAVTPTAKLMGIQNFALDPGIKSKVYHDRRGSLAPGYLEAIESIEPAAPLEMLVTYEDVCYLLDNLLGQATPSGAGPYTRNYAGPVGSVPSPRLLTWVYGDGTNCYKLTSGLLSKLTLKGETGAPMMATADLIGKDVTAGTKAALSDRSVAVAMGDHMALYIDAWGGTIGTTLLSAASWSYELTLDAKRKVDIYFGNLAGQSYHEDDGANGWDVMLKLKLEFNAALKAQYDALISQAAVYQRQVRLKSTSGTKVLQLDFAGTAEESPRFGDDRNGVLVFEVGLKGEYNAGLGNYFKAQSINSVSSLT
jgi:hypothetical protein